MLLFENVPLLQPPAEAVANQVANFVFIADWVWQFFSVWAVGQVMLITL